MTYDAWNRPVKIKDNATPNTVAEYAYNGLGRVVKRIFPPIYVTRWYYYDEGWRVLTERTSTVGGSSYRIVDYVWGAQYIDEVVCRIDRTQTPAVRMDFVQDANWNVITLLEADGDVAERYGCDCAPYHNDCRLEASIT